MAALLALLCFVLDTFHAKLANINLVSLGLAFMALHFIVGLWPIGTVSVKKNQSKTQ
jgi:hypothetical protein